MLTKMIEIRDHATCIPALAISSAGQTGIEHAFLRRAGFDDPKDAVHIILMRLASAEAAYDPYAWNGSRTMRVAHEYIKRHFYTLPHGAVVDVRVIVGEKVDPAEPEIGFGGDE